MPTSTYPALFEPLLLGATSTGIYTVPSTTGMVLRGLVLKINNVTAATRLVTIYASTAGSENTTTAVVINHSVPPNDWIIVPIQRVAATGTITGFSDAANALNVMPYEDTGRLYVP